MRDHLWLDVIKSAVRKRSAARKAPSRAAAGLDTTQRRTQVGAQVQDSWRGSEGSRLRVASCASCVPMWCASVDAFGAHVRVEPLAKCTNADAQAPRRVLKEDRSLGGYDSALL